jgi:hypothetical protein
MKQQEWSHQCWHHIKRPNLWGQIHKIRRETASKTWLNTKKKRKKRLALTSGFFILHRDFGNFVAGIKTIMRTLSYIFTSVRPKCNNQQKVFVIS